MKALTISQPFASLIASGAKFVENRSWETRYRGPLAIHAGKGTQYLSRKQIEVQGMPIGQVVAIARLARCLQVSGIRLKAAFPDTREEIVPCTNKTWEEYALHKHTEGPWCWLLEDVMVLSKPVDAVGKQGLWNWDENLIK